MRRHTPIPLRLLAALVLLAPLLPASAGALATTGSVTGRVTAADGGAPLAGVLVHLAGTDVADSGFTRTGADGTWRADDLDAGTYVVTFHSDDGHLEERFDAAGPLDAPTPVGVLAGRTTAGIDAALTRAATVRGTVVLPSSIDASGARVVVAALSPTAGDGPLAVAGTDGRFTLTGLHPGPTYLRVVVLDAPIPSTWHAGAATIGAATPLELAAGERRTGVTIAVPDCAAADRYPDVHAANPFCGAIDWLDGSEATRGYADGTFRPTAAITRGALAAFLHRLAGSPAGPFPDPGFVDVDAEHPFATAIAWMAATGTSTGYADDTYRPGATVSRGALAAFLARLADAGLHGAAVTDGCAYADVCTGGAITDGILWVTATGVLGGYADGTFRPASPISRQALAAALLRDRQRSELAAIAPALASSAVP